MKSGVSLVYAVCALFCVVVFGAAVVLERGAAAASRRAAGAADRGVAAALAAWDAQNVPSSDRVLTLFIDDELDGDDASGAGPSLADALRAEARKLLHPGSEPRRHGMELPGAVVDWRTQTLAWASDRETQYDAIVRSLATAKKAGVRVQLVARGRGAGNVLAGLRRGGVLPDRMLIVGRRPEAGDERLAGDVAFVYAAPDGAEAVYTGADGAFIRSSGGSVDALLASVGATMARGVPFRAAAPRTGMALPLTGRIGGAISGALSGSFPRP